MKLVTAAAIGTAAMTASQHLEMRFTGRSPSSLPADVIEQIARRQIPRPMKTAAGMVAQTGLGATAALGAHLLRFRSRTLTLPALTAALVVGDGLLAAGLGVADPPCRWSSSELAVDVLHKGVLAGVSSVAVATDGISWVQ